jgi:hypothetical protein
MGWSAIEDEEERSPSGRYYDAVSSQTIRRQTEG